MVMLAKNERQHDEQEEIEAPWRADHGGAIDYCGLLFHKHPEVSKNSIRFSFGGLPGL